MLPYVFSYFGEEIYSNIIKSRLKLIKDNDIELYGIISQGQEVHCKNQSDLHNLVKWLYQASLYHVIDHVVKIGGYRYSGGGFYNYSLTREKNKKRILKLLTICTKYVPISPNELLCIWYSYVPADPIFCEKTLEIIPAEISTLKSFRAKISKSWYSDIDKNIICEAISDKILFRSLRYTWILSNIISR